jgi:hypothetical protein
LADVASEPCQMLSLLSQTLSRMTSRGFRSRFGVGRCAVGHELGEFSEWTAAGDGQVFIPTTRSGKAYTEPASAESSGRVLLIQLDVDVAEPTFLAAWLNSE